MKHVLKLKDMSVHNNRRGFDCTVDTSVSIPAVGDGIYLDGVFFSDREEKLFICKKFNPDTNFCRFLIVNELFLIEDNFHFIEGINWFELIPYSSRKGGLK